MTHFRKTNLKFNDLGENSIPKNSNIAQQFKEINLGTN